MTPVFLILPNESVDVGFLFARKCFLNAFAKGEAPLNLRFAYAGALDLRSEHEVAMATEAAAVWMGLVPRVICYIDEGITRSMKDDLERAKRREKRIVFRRLVGQVGVEHLHLQNVPHDESDCALCREVKWKEEQRLRTTGKLDE